MTNTSHFKKGGDASERGALGRNRMKQIADENKRAIQTNSESMINGLGRAATELERMTAEGICSLFLRAARLRDRGMDDSEILMKAALMTSQSCFRSPLDCSPRSKSD
jgi:hypothetical protein